MSTDPTRDLLSDDHLDDIRARAETAARYGNEGFFVDSLIFVAEKDVPLLLAEIKALRERLAGGAAFHDPRVVGRAT
jgi:hypothetical protein